MPSVANELIRFTDTGGVNVGRTSGTGYVYMTSGVYSTNNLLKAGIGNSLSAVGASNVARVGVWPNIETDGFMYWVWNGLGTTSRMMAHAPVAQAGETLAQSLTRVQDPTNGYPAHIAAYGRYPSHALIQAGRNDMIFATAADVVGKLQTYESIVDYLLGIGIMPIITALFPTDNAASASQHQRNTVNYNLGLALMASKKGVPFLDTNSLIVDTTTGGLTVAYQSDAEHPNDIGGKIIGIEFAAQILSTGFTLPWKAPLALSNDANSAAALKLTNPLMMTDTNVDGTPDNWTKAGSDGASTTVSIPSGSGDGILGNWMKIVKSASTADATLTSSSMSVTAGNWMWASWVEKYVHTSGTPAITTRLRTGSTDIVYKKIQTTSGQAAGITRHSQIFKIPVGETAMTMAVLMHAIGEYYLGQVTIVDLTAVGLNAWI